MFNKFYKKTREERLKILKNNHFISEEDYQLLLKNNIRLNKNAEMMIENQLSTYEMPYGVATDFLIDDEEYIIPMASEEPSVIAAASYAAKTIKSEGGFKTVMDYKLLTGQIVFYEGDFSKINNFNEEEYFLYAKEVYPSLYKYGGGLKSIYFNELDSFLTMYIVLDTQEAMGANMMNTILEAFAKKMQQQYDFKVLFAILSNYSDLSVAKASFEINVDCLKKEDYTGLEIAEKIVLANEYAKKDIYRATTHNKGIMNGISALVLASGNDTRSIEASIHTYAKGKPLTHYYIEDNKLKGEIAIPITLGSIGGTINVHPMAQLTKKILNQPNAKRLSCICAALGLAQNFSALRALVSSGIQKGHMKLHYRTLALSCGAKEEDIEMILAHFHQQTVKNKETMSKLISDYYK